MKKSNIATDYLLIKAMTNSEWDNGDFAIIHITKEWKEIQQKRLESVSHFENDFDLKWLNYADTNVDFYQFADEQYPEIEQWLSETEQVFIEISPSDMELLIKPENRLNCYQMQVFKSGNAIYNAFGKHTGEEFYTTEFSLKQLL